MAKHNIRVTAIRREPVDVTKLTSALLRLIEELAEQGEIDDSSAKESAA